MTVGVVDNAIYWTTHSAALIYRDDCLHSSGCTEMYLQPGMHHPYVVVPGTLLYYRILECRCPYIGEGNIAFSGAASVKEVDRRSITL